MVLNNNSFPLLAVAIPGHIGGFEKEVTAENESRRWERPASEIRRGVGKAESVNRAGDRSLRSSVRHDACMRHPLVRFGAKVFSLACYLSLGGALACSASGAQSPLILGPNPAGCPASFGSDEGGACPETLGICQYQTGACGCESCLQPDAGSQFFWRCRPWSDIPAGCPAPAPAEGSACGLPDGTVCDYARCCDGPPLGPNLKCMGGSWQSYVDTTCSCASICP